MHAYDMTTLLEEQTRSGQRYWEFLRVPALSLGVYRLPAGGIDPQSPHSEDEVYYVVSGKALIRVGEEDRAVGAGSIVYVAAQAPHRFHTIEEDLTILVCFAPAEYSNQQRAS
jgi:mannose-6-phosphate isomerase-like protein (cupin superfamily)